MIVELFVFRNSGLKLLDLLGQLEAIVTFDLSLGSLVSQFVHIVRYLILKKESLNLIMLVALDPDYSDLWVLKSLLIFE